MHEYDGVNLTIIYRGQLVITGMLSPLPFYLPMLTGRSDLCIAGVFGAGKTRSLAVLLVLRAPHLSCSSFHKGKRCHQGLERPNCGT